MTFIYYVISIAFVCQFNCRISTNPFGSDSENEFETDNDSLSAKRTPVPTPRKPM